MSALLLLALAVAVPVSASLMLALSGDKYSYWPLRVSLGIGGAFVGFTMWVFSVVSAMAGLQDVVAERTELEGYITLAAIYIPLLFGLLAAIGPRFKAILWSGRVITYLVCPAVAFLGVWSVIAGGRTPIGPGVILWSLAGLMVPAVCWEVLVRASKQPPAKPADETTHQ